MLFHLHKSGKTAKKRKRCISRTFEFLSNRICLIRPQFVTPKYFFCHSLCNLEVAASSPLKVATFLGLIYENELIYMQLFLKLAFAKSNHNVSIAAAFKLQSPRFLDFLKKAARFLISWLAAAVPHPSTFFLITFANFPAAFLG